MHRRFESIKVYAYCNGCILHVKSNVYTVAFILSRCNGDRNPEGHCNIILLVPMQGHTVCQAFKAVPNVIFSIFKTSVEVCE